MQFGHAGLRITLTGDNNALALASDWQFPATVVAFRSAVPRISPSLKLASPTGEILREWHTHPGCVELGSALRDHLTPNFAFLPFEDVRATD
jgi:hypothetical protein